jgi:catechol 2,3-dioxygenase-like lactoylglutathione lyase family enzyme
VFDHVTLRASDRAASERFYDTVLATLGLERTASGGQFTEWDDFSVAQAQDGVTRGVHIGFVALSRDHVHAFWEAGTAAGYRDDGPPGERDYTDDYYGSFLLDPDGNSAEAVHHGSMRRGGAIDHIWIRVADIAAARAFYVTIAPYGAFRLQDDEGHLVRFAGHSGSFSVLAGDPITQHLHMAFPVGDDATVDDFHRAATAAGFRDNGPPGERPQYHPGYYSAFVLDPDGNNIEVVHHTR